MDWVGESRLLNDWYDVVMAVVAVGPLAIGVRYSVCEPGRGVEDEGELETLGFEAPAPPCLAFAWANFASLEVGRSPDDAADASAAV